MAALALGACSLASVGYQRLPELGTWWVQRYVPLSEGQRERLREGLQAWQAQHQRSQLPQAVALLRDWQQRLGGPIGAEDACRAWDEAKALLVRAAVLAAPVAAELAQTLDEAQLTALAERQRRGDEELARQLRQPSGWRWGRAAAAEAALDGPAAARLQRLVERYEWLYGSLTPAQVQLLAQGARGAAQDVPRILAERQRRNADLLATLQRMRAPGPAALPASASGPAPQAQLLWHGWVQRALQPPAPEDAQWLQAQTVAACQQFAALHHSASADQRQHAQRLLGGYAQALGRLVGS